MAPPLGPKRRRLPDGRPATLAPRGTVRGLEALRTAAIPPPVFDNMLCAVFLYDTHQLLAQALPKIVARGGLDPTRSNASARIAEALVAFRDRMRDYMVEHGGALLEALPLRSATTARQITPATLAWLVHAQVCAILDNLFVEPCWPIDIARFDTERRTTLAARGLLCTLEHPLRLRASELHRALHLLMHRWPMVPADPAGAWWLAMLERRAMMLALGGSAETLDMPDARESAGSGAVRMHPDYIDFLSLLFLRMREAVRAVYEFPRAPPCALPGVPAAVLDPVCNAYQAVWDALVAYANGIREPGGIRAAIEADVVARSQFPGERDMFARDRRARAPSQRHVIEHVRGRGAARAITDDVRRWTLAQMLTDCTAPQHAMVRSTAVVRLFASFVQARGVRSWIEHHVLYTPHFYSRAPQAAVAAHPVLVEAPGGEFLLLFRQTFIETRDPFFSVYAWLATMRYAMPAEHNYTLRRHLLAFFPSDDGVCLT